MRRRKTVLRNLAAACLGALLLCIPAGQAGALERFELRTPGATEDLRDRLRAASLVAEARREGEAQAQDLFAAARADYGRLLGVLYAEGHYSGVIRIRIDGREAAEIPPLDAPQRIGAITIEVIPGPRFAFSRAAIGPLAPGTELPEGFRAGAAARSGTIVDAASAGVDGWRGTGHAKARVSGQRLVADHAAARLSADIALSPGPRVRFGELRIRGQERMIPRRLAKIAGFPTGEVYDPAELETVAERLRRTGVFRSIALTEAERLGPGNTLDVDLVVTEEKLRRLSFGAELSSFDGLRLSGYWLHRNLRGGAERLRIDGDISGIGAQAGGTDYGLGIRIDRPATLSPDTTAFVEANAARRSEEDYTLKTAALGIGFNHVFSENLTGEIGLRYRVSEVDRPTPQRYRSLELPIRALYDSRDNVLDATEGLYLDATAKPFLGFGTTGSGLRLTGDARAYRAFGSDGRFVLAGRVQAGTILGPSLLETPREDLFYSGGGGSVRGHPYQSLGVLLAPDLKIGGKNWLGVSGELRAGITDRIGIVAFYDAGYVSAGDFFDDSGEWHAGAGLGLRYDTGIGPIRLDVAAPVSGDTGEGVQIYIGIGQAF